MKTKYQLIALACVAASLFLTGCNDKKKTSIWEGQKTTSKDKDLWGNSEELAQNDDLAGPSNEDFIPLREEDLQTAFSDGALPQPQETPGEQGSDLPAIERFQDPNSHLSSVFKTLYFNTDDHILRGQESLAALDRIAAYLKENPEVYIFIEGHCDERGPEAYNLSLGTRRANYVRSMLAQRGVDPNRLHTVSYGKERPATEGHGQEAWKKNRRAQFKIYNKS